MCVMCVCRCTLIDFKILHPSYHWLIFEYLLRGRNPSLTIPQVQTQVQLGKIIHLATPDWTTVTLPGLGG